MEDKNLKGHAALFVAYIIFGLNTPIAKAVLMHGEVSAMALTFYRMAGAMALFWLTSLFTKKEQVNFRDLCLLFWAAMFGILINQMSFIIGLSLTSPIDASVITTIGPVLTMVLAVFFLKEPITWKKAIGVLVGASGALLLILNGNTASRGGASIGGNLLCLLSSLSFAVYLSAFKKIILKYSAVTLMKWMFLFATVCCLPICWNDITTIDYTGIPADIYLRILFVVALATYFAYLLIPVGQKLLRPTIVSMYNYIQPIVSSLVAVALGMDVFGWVKGSATLLVFLGVYIVTQSKSYAQIKAEKNYPH
ncbi:MAG: DMT family transporter [Candidatus Symbiothrix sp.]|jgi:drug/metabolite transporter (DMT)-like permease|nr:DMT family transporter [Candidatus Symbiothrix sp.]